MVGRLWLIGGTRDSAELSQALMSANIPCTVTVTTPSAQKLYPDSPLLQLWVGRLTLATVAAFLQQNSIGAVLDASHPFAAKISELAISTAERYQLPYLRYERPVVALNHPWLVTVPSLEVLLAQPPLPEERILLLLGSRWLQRFQPWQQQTTLFTRILPTPTALAAALAAGFGCDRICALRPPVSTAVETALWQQWRITRVITKASGLAGGEDTKAEVSRHLQIPLHIVQRPKVTYTHLTNHLSEAIRWASTLSQNQSRNSERIR